MVLSEHSVFLLAFLMIPPVCALISVKCPCEEERLCKPLQTTPKQEVLAFSVSNNNWIKYDWDRVTTVIQFRHVYDNLTCYAHSKGARSIMAVSFSVTNLTSTQYRLRWISQQVETARKHFLDGVNVDFEGEIDANDSEKRQAVTTLYAELAIAFRETFPDPKISFDFPWSPDCLEVDKRCYSYDMLAAISDYVMVMAYDERSQITGACVAFANSAYNTTVHGVERYIQLGIPPDKLILGVPWYGYVYPCTEVEKDLTCHIKKVPFRSSNCTDAAGTEEDYSRIMNVRIHQAVSDILFHPIAKSPYFLIKDTDGTLKEVWYDNPESLSIKYKYAVERGLRGIGMWCADSLDYSDTAEGRKEQVQMWGAIPFTKGKIPYI